MFDEQNAQAGGVPPKNLPVVGPEDIFADAESAAPSLPGASPPKADEAGPPSALSAGALRPKMVSAPPSAVPSDYPLKAPKLSRYLMAVALIVFGVAVIGGGGWFLYSSFIHEESPTRSSPGASPPKTDEAAPSLPEQTTDEQALFGEPIDLDGDSLDEARERALGTDPYNWDTDGDGLSDYDEVAIWKTDPLNADTDGDTYKDGDEVKNGYNPAGPGKIFEPPTDASG
jgi:hypothetical protein